MLFILNFFNKIFPIAFKFIKNVYSISNTFSFKKSIILTIKTVKYDNIYRSFIISVISGILSWNKLTNHIKRVTTTEFIKIKFVNSFKKSEYLFFLRNKVNFKDSFIAFKKFFDWNWYLK